MHLVSSHRQLHYRYTYPYVYLSLIDPVQEMCGFSLVVIVLFIFLQTDMVEEELCSVYIPTNHLYIGDIFLVNSKEIIKPNLSIREGIGMEFRSGFY